MIIDPPVFPGSPREKIEAWIAQLEETRAEHRDVAARASIDRSLEEARGWLKLKDSLGR